MADTFLSENQAPLNQQDTKTRFSGQAVIITGGANGIGRATVERFLNDGATKVAVFDINEEAGKDLIKWALQNKSEVMFCKVDVTDKSQCEMGVAKVVDKFGDQINHLVNSVAIFGFKGLNSTKEDWDRVLSVNVRGYVNVVQACYPYMKNSNCWKLSSICGHVAGADRWTYGASKGAVITLTKCMALDFSADGVRVNCVSPAWIWTQANFSTVDGNQERLDKIVENFHMLRRQGRTSEVAAAITFLCSKDAAFITATDLHVDGGYLALGPEQLGKDSPFGGTNY